MISGPDAAYRFTPVDEASEYDVVASVEFVFIGGVEHCKVPLDEWEPEGWKEFALEKWGPDVERHEYEGTVVLPYMPFFWPKTGVIVKSRSTAQRTVDIIRHWGGSAELLECTPVWLPVDEANARRKQARKQKRIAKLEAQIAELKEVK